MFIIPKCLTFAFQDLFVFLRTYRNLSSSKININVQWISIEVTAREKVCSGVIRTMLVIILKIQSHFPPLSRLNKGTIMPPQYGLCVAV